jgi:hypothetical protein
MATYSPEEIARMKDELRKDLEALERVERLLASRNGAAPHTEPPNTRGFSVSELPSELPLQSVVLGVKSLCIAGLKRAGEVGAAPKDLLSFFKAQGYVFSSDTNGSASITTALSRLVNAEKVRRTDGRYYWIER